MAIFAYLQYKLCIYADWVSLKSQKYADVILEAYMLVFILMSTFETELDTCNPLITCYSIYADTLQMPNAYYLDAVRLARLHS